MKRILAVLAACAVALIPAAALAAPAAASTDMPRIGINELFYSQNVGTALWMHAHAVGDVMSTQATNLQTFWTQDPQTWLDTTTGKYVTTVEVALGSNNGYCATWNSSDNKIYLEACSPGFADGSQQWYWQTYSGSEQWVINADATAHVPGHTENMYLTDIRSDHELIVQGPGNGFNAIWAVSCQNC